jgi:tripartite-type tricarboxylate transporter receptor subunit TctC
MQFVPRSIALICAACCGAAIAQSYPAKPVRVIVPDAAGGPDVLARLLSPSLQAQTGQPFVVENRAGANTIVGSEVAAKAPADGYTLLLTTTAFSINPSIYKKLPYDPIKDFTPITQVSGIEAMIVAVPASFPVRTLQEFVAEAKKDGKVSWGSPGVGNIMHLSGALLQAKAGTRMLHVPYKGTGPAIQALFANEVQLISGPAIVLLQGVQAGKLRALAYTHRTRAAALPDVPTTSEAGVPGIEMDGGWFGMFSAAGTSTDIANRVHQEVRRALGEQKVRERVLAMGTLPVASSPEEFRKFVQAQITKYSELARLANIEPE